MKGCFTFLASLLYSAALVLIWISRPSLFFQANPDGGTTPASGLRKSARDVRYPLRRHAAHHQEEERTLKEGGSQSRHASLLVSFFKAVHLLFEIFKYF